MELSKRWINQRRMELMSHTSDAEKCARSILSRLGYNVIPQYPINTGRRIYFADLYIPSKKCIVEIDGGYHFTSDQRRKDSNRSHGLWRLGYHVLRLSNHDARSILKIKSKLSLLKNT